MITNYTQDDYSELTIVKGLGYFIALALNIRAYKFNDFDEEDEDFNTLRNFYYYLTLVKNNDML